MVLGERLLVIAGSRTDGSNIAALNDVWSSADGRQWQLVTADADFSPRTTLQAISFDGKVWVIGGNGLIGDNPLLNDVWSSEDGQTWTNVTTAAAFSARYRHQVVAFNDSGDSGTNKLWLIGGDSDASSQNAGLDNDVWSSEDGQTWTNVVPNNDRFDHFSRRGFHQATVFNDQLCVIGGLNTFALRNDVWCSPDGAVWTRYRRSRSEL